MHIYFLRETYFSSIHKENYIICSVNPPNWSNLPNRLMPGTIHKPTRLKFVLYVALNEFPSYHAHFSYVFYSRFLFLELSPIRRVEKTNVLIWPHTNCH